MKKELIWLGLSALLLVATFAGGLIDHGDIDSAILILLSLPCLVLVILCPKASPILLLLAASFIAAGAGLALWRRQMFIAIIPASCSYLCVVIGLLQLKRKIAMAT